MAETIEKHMIEMLRDAYSAEKQALRAMPRMMRHATSQSLKGAIQMHIDQTEGQVERLEKAFEAMGARPGRKTCEGMRGIIEEAQHEMEDHEKGPMMDLVITAAQQKIEHYEIASYGTMAAVAKACGKQDVAQLLAETLREEEETDKKLSQLGESEINPKAIEGAQAANDPKGGRGKAA